MAYGDEGTRRLARSARVGCGKKPEEAHKYNTATKSPYLGLQIRFNNNFCLTDVYYV
jgi:hypothetical protein